MMDFCCYSNKMLSKTIILQLEFFNNHLNTYIPFALALDR